MAVSTVNKKRIPANHDELKREEVLLSLYGDQYGRRIHVVFYSDHTVQLTADDDHENPKTASVNIFLQALSDGLELI